MTEEMKIKVGFGDTFRELTVRIPDGDIPPYQPGDPLDLVGTSEIRLDAVAKVTGTAEFTYDRQPKGLIYGKILRSPHANANIRSIDVSQARALEGVRAVLTTPDVFEDSTARYAGAEIAAVAADSEAIADEAVRMIEVDYEVLPFCVTIDDSMAEGAPKVGRGNQENVDRVSPRARRRRRGGEINADAEASMVARMKEREKTVDKLFAKSKGVVEGEFRTQVQTHAPLETHGVVCDWDGKNLLCYGSSQATFGFKRELGSSRGPVGAKDVRVICEYVGGGFGSKFSAGREGVLGAMLAREAGKPVRLMLDRKEEQTSAGNRPDSLQKLKMGVAADGTILAYRVRSWGTPGTGTGGAGAHNDGIYNLGEIDKVEYGVRTNCGGARAHRAPGWPQGVFALEQMMDMGAQSVGLDPIEFRKRNDDHPIRTAQYDIAREKIGWDRPRVRGGAATVCRGVGVASNLWFSAGGRGTQVMVRVHKDGQVEVRNGAQDIGTGTRTVMGMVAAEELGLPLARVRTFIGDTRDPQGPGSGGSTTIGSITPAARLAGYVAKQRLLEVVAARKNWPIDQLGLRRGHVTRSGDPVLSFDAACQLMEEDVIEVLESRKANYAGFSDTNAGVQCAEVEVDTETGEVRVIKVVAVADAGKLINPMLAESQVRGGVSQGVGYALLERRIMDSQEGRMVNPNLEMYKLLGAVDCPEIEVVLFDVYNGKSNTSVMGLGEPPIVATAAAVANAVSDAIGVRITEIPITPRKVLEALGRKGSDTGKKGE